MLKKRPTKKFIPTTKKLPGADVGGTPGGSGSNASFAEDLTTKQLQKSDSELEEDEMEVAPPPLM